MSIILQMDGNEGVELDLEKVNLLQSQFPNAEINVDANGSGTALINRMIEAGIRVPEFKGRHNAG